MIEVRHSVLLDKDKCHGCTNCIKTCPTQAIRVRGGKAKIIKSKCIDCGECIRVCPYHAKKAVTDSFDKLKNYKYKVVLPAPTLYGQFFEAENIDCILHALLKVGFDEVYEVAYAAQIITHETKKLMESKMLEKPAINSACPAVVKLIATRFPNLINNVIPVISPMQLAGKLAKEDAVKKTGLKPEEIGVFFITPCAAKATCAQYPIGLENSHIDGVFSVKDVYLKVLPHLKECKSLEPIARAGFSGICWANSGGEASASGRTNYIAVDGIHNVLRILEEIENNRLKDIEFVELLACTGGCVGGPLNVENCFVAKRKVKTLAESSKVTVDESEFNGKEFDVMWKVPVPVMSKLMLDDDMMVAMQKLAKIEEIYASLPKLDCGSCGSPTCRAHAEDIVQGYTKKDACIVKFKEKILRFAEDVILLEKSEDDEGK